MSRNARETCQRATKLDATLTYALNFLELEFWTSSFLVNVIRTYFPGVILLLMHTSVALEVSDSLGVIRFPPLESHPSFKTKSSTAMTQLYEVPYSVFDWLLFARENSKS